ncbi:MAG TPA: 2-phosphoglycerate kinase [Actinomycetota bacterium]
MRKNKTPNIIIIDREPGFPYSKGLMANRMMVTGLSPLRSYQVAERIEDTLLERARSSISSDELSGIAVEVLADVAGERYAKNYLRWRTVEQLDVPMVILIGGATGVGKSTIATQMAARLGIVRVVPTDAIREVMRALFSHELMPTLYTSSFEAGAVLREPPSRPADKTVVGFREQTAAVAVGVRGLIERSAVEGMSTVIEGAHLVPGFLEASPFADRALIVPMVVTVEDEVVHRNHFVARSSDSSARPFNRYLDGFEEIRKVQKYIKSQALSHDWPVIPNYNLDQALSSAIDLVVDRATERAAAGAGTPPVLELEGGKTG